MKNYMKVFWFMIFHITLRVRFDKTDGFIRVYDETRCLASFVS